MNRKLLVGILLLSLAIAMYHFERTFLPSFGIDWYGTYYPATLLLLRFQNPYLISTLHNPFWALFPLIPFVLLGQELGAIMLFFVSFLAYVYVAWKLNASALAIILFMISPLVLFNLMIGNIDWLVMLGFIMPPSFGLFLVLLKPQIGIGIAIYWLWVSYKSGGMRLVWTTFLPTLLLTAFSFILFGNWLTGRGDYLFSAFWNRSVFPYSVPVGLILLNMARNRKNRAIAASPFLSPYVSFGSLSIVQLGLIDNNILVYVVTVSLWLFYFLLS